jgi:prepilin-type N-terminal cleavage/methylation domain-containing protein
MAGQVRSRIRRDSRDERGVTLVEVLIASVLTLVVLAMGYGILSTTTKTAATVTSRAVNSTDARQAITLLEANLRYADAVWVCGPGASGTCPAVPANTVANLVVTNAAGSNVVTQPACARWSVTTAGLVETASGVSTTVMPGVSAATTAGFALPLPHLVQIDLKVNTETGSHVVAADAVTVHDLVTPDNLTTTQAAPTTLPPC